MIKLNCVNLALPSTVLLMAMLFGSLTFAEASSKFLAGDLVIEEIAGGLDKPTGVEFIGNNILITQKDNGQVVHLRDYKVERFLALDVNVNNYETDGGLLGITSTTYNNTVYVFLFYSENNGSDGGAQFEPGPGNRVYRYEWNGENLVRARLVLDLPSTPTTINSGGKIAIGPDGQLYALIGDLDRSGREQNSPKDDPSTYWLYDNKTESSAILRTTIDGLPSADNPFSSKRFERLFAYGIRNSFGLGFDPVTGNLWNTEKGPGNNDEINLVKKGFNSGWKQIQGKAGDACCSDGDVRLSQDTDDLYRISGSHYQDPKFVWKESPPVTALAFLGSDKLGADYQNDLFVGDMQGNIYHFDLTESREDLVKSSTDHIVATGFGSISDIKTGPDGALYVVTFANNTGYPIGNNTGSLYRIAKDPLVIVPAVQKDDALMDVMGSSGIVVIAAVAAGAAVSIAKLRNRSATGQPDKSGKPWSDQ